MEMSILQSTKKVLGLDKTYTAFDADIITHINAVFSTLNQLGVGPVNGFAITGEAEEWDALQLPLNQLSMVKSYLYLKVRTLFDPPGTSFLIEANNKAAEEFEWRLSLFREQALIEADLLIEEAIEEVEV